jgi:histidine ammonia-lyase
MGAWAARKAGMVITNTRRVLAMEFLAAAQGIEFLRPLKSSARIEAAISLIRKKVAALKRDRSFHADLQYLENLLEGKKL